MLCTTADFERTSRRALVRFAALSALAILLSACAAQSDDLRSSDPLPDLSGLTWMGGERFVAVHDAKTPGELERPRVSVIAIPRSLDGVLWRPSDPGFPEAKSSDLESAARLPGTNKLLLVESTDNASDFDRLFLAELAGNHVKVLDVTRWNAFTETYNVEATAIARTKAGGFLLLWAERSSGKTSTEIKWTGLTLAPFTIGAGGVSSIPFQLPKSAYDEDGKPLYTRPLVAMDVDSAGRLYVAATYDPEGTVSDPDNGPFRSAVYAIGRVADDAVVLDTEPQILGLLDGLKVESVTVREHDGEKQIFVGVDDENYGGILRLLPPSEVPSR